MRDANRDHLFAAVPPGFQSTLQTGDAFRPRLPTGRDQPALVQGVLEELPAADQGGLRRDEGFEHRRDFVLCTLVENGRQRRRNPDQTRALIFRREQREAGDTAAEAQQNGQQHRHAVAPPQLPMDRLQRIGAQRVDRFVNKFVGFRPDVISGGFAHGDPLPHA